MVVSEYTGFDNIAELHCDEVLVSAGLHPHWQPNELPEALEELALDVYECIESGTAEIDGRTRDNIEMFGDVLVATLVSDYFKADHDRKNDEVKPAFRAHSAQAGRVGNCIAMAEGINGILGKLGLAKNAVTFWGGGHASNGLIIKNDLLKLDGWHETADFSDPVSEERRNARLSTVKSGSVSLFDSGQNPTRIVTLPPEDLHTIDVSAEKDQPSPTLMMPAASAVLTFCGMAAQRNPNPKYPDAANVLRPYTPVF